MGKIKFAPYTFIIPAIILLLIFNIYPIIETIGLSFMTQQRGELIFNGIDNYKQLFTDQFFWISIKNSIIYLLIQVPIMTLLALVLAVILHKGIKKGKGVFRTTYFTPVVVDSVAYSLIFSILFQEQGLVNYLLSFLNIDAIPWVRQEWPAKILIMVVMTWRWTGYNMVMFLAGLQSIPDDYYEAAQLDGASAWHTFWHITVPSLKHIIIFSTILSTNGTLNLFTEPYLISQGGPNNSTLSIGLYIYRQAFQSFNLTYAATVSIAIVIIVAILAKIQLHFGRDHD